MICGRKIMKGSMMILVKNQVKNCENYKITIGKLEN